MKCKTVCRLCPRLIVSQAVTFADGTLTVNIPAGSYADGEKYCIVVAQTIPAATTITAPVVEYPLVNCGCAQVTACALRTRTRYATVVSTNATGGSFKMLGKGCCTPSYNLSAIDGTDAAAAGGGA